MLVPDTLRDARGLRSRGLGVLAILAVGAFSSTTQAAPAEDDEVDVDLSDFDPDADEPSTSDPDTTDPGTTDTADAQDTSASASPPAAPELPEPPVDDGFDAATPTISIIGEPAEQPRIVGSAHSVDEETLEREEHDDIHRILRTVPGVYVRGEDGYGLRPNIGLRGGDPNRSAKVTLMEDGVLFGPAPYSAPAAYYFPMPTRLVGVEVFKGPAAVRFGPNTIGGAINLQTRDIPRELETGIDIAAGTWGYGKLHGFAGKSWKRFGILFEGARVRASGFKELDGGGDTGFRKNEFMLKTRLHGDPGARVYHQFDVKFGLSTEVSNETYLGLTQEDFDENPYRRYRATALDRMNWWRTQMQATYFMATGIVEYQSTLYRHDFSRAWTKFNNFAGAAAPDPYTFFEDPTSGTNGILLAVLRGEADSTGEEENLLIGTNQRDFVSQGWQNAVRISPNTRYVDQVIEVGARLHFDRVSRNEDEDQYAMLSGTPALVAGTQQAIVKNRGEALAGSFHVADEIRIVDRFTVSPGARVEVIRTEFEETNLGDGTFPIDPDAEVTTSSSVDTVFLPGIGFHVQATPWLGVLGGVHSGFAPKAPGRGASVQPERSVSYEAGLRAAHSGFHTEGIAFVNDYSNLVSNCTFSQGCDATDVGSQFSGGEVLVAGAESLAGYETELGGAGWINANATYTFTWTRFSNTFSSSSPFLGDVERGDKVPYIPEHVASLQLVGGMRRWNAHAQLHYNGQMRDVPGKGPIPSQERIDRFLTLDLGGSVNITRRAQIYLNLGNATRASYAVSRRPFGLRPGQRFTLVGGFKHRFG
ncbi:MAG: TonB-dependent receptor family protein [Nannocystales bacterium]